MKQVYLLTGNKDKIAAANLIFNKYGVEVLSLDLDLPEIQANTSAEIASYTAREAFKLKKLPVIREDHSLFINELGMPGPYMAYIDKVIDVDHLVNILSTLKDRSGHFELSASFIDKDGIEHQFSYQVPIIFAKEPKGDNNQRWERLMMFPNEKRTFAEYPSDERTEVWSKNYQEIAKLIAAE